APPLMKAREGVEVAHGGAEDHRPAAPAADPAVTAEHANLKRFRNGLPGSRRHGCRYRSASSFNARSPSRTSVREASVLHVVLSFFVTAGLPAWCFCGALSKLLHSRFSP